MQRRRVLIICREPQKRTARIQVRAAPQSRQPNRIGQQGYGYEPHHKADNLKNGVAVTPQKCNYRRVRAPNKSLTKLLERRGISPNDTSLRMVWLLTTHRSQKLGLSKNSAGAVISPLVELFRVMSRTMAEFILGSPDLAPWIRSKMFGAPPSTTEHTQFNREG